MAKYTPEQLKAQDAEKWTDSYIKEWGEKSGKVDFKSTALGKKISGEDPDAKTDPTAIQTAEDASEVLAYEAGEFKVGGGMEEVGQTSAGLSSIESGVVSGLSGEGGALLYDEATGKIYRTENWKDVQKNWDSLVDSKGNRQKLLHVSVGQTELGESGYKIGKTGGPAGVDIFIGASEKVPEAGTLEFQDWLGEKFEEGVMEQAASHKYSSESGTTGTGYGGYGSISIADWVALGKPKKIGNDDIVTDVEGLSSYSDEQLKNMSGSLITFDSEERSHGIEKGLNKVGGLVGYDRLGKEVMKAAENVGKLGIAGGLTGITIGAVADAQNAYQAGRNAGMSGSAALKEGGKAGTLSMANAAVDAAQTALVTAAVVLTGGVGGIAAGAAVGAATGYLGGMLKYSAQSTLYGGYDEGNMLKSSEKAGAAGAVSGAVSGASAAVGGAVGGKWAGSVAGKGFSYGTIASKAFDASANAAKTYVISHDIYGASGKDSMEAVNWSLGSSAVSALGDYNDGKFASDLPYRASGASSSAYDVSGYTKDNVKITPGLGTLGKLSIYGRGYIRTFREVAASNSLLSASFGRGTATRKGLLAEAAEKKASKAAEKAAKATKP